MRVILPVLLRYTWHIILYQFNMCVCVCTYVCVLFYTFLSPEHLAVTPCQLAKAVSSISSAHSAPLCVHQSFFSLQVQIFRDCNLVYQVSYLVCNFK